MHVANEHDWIGNRRGGGWLGESGRGKRKEASVLGVFIYRGGGSGGSNDGGSHIPIRGGELPPLPWNLKLVMDVAGVYESLNSRTPSTKLRKKMLHNSDINRPLPAAATQ
ncbi:hypothetical protein K0M31_000479 [Melipona bicolor]|uniref:Uncharacterized protein n=1 Tax=Melipona bicolor TaxID=60889 RepID=A0AA40GDX1_9HYME|nr:hypothetical protein K0M31_000479 [Melipona bicolor]